MPGCGLTTHIKVTFDLIVQRRLTRRLFSSSQVQTENHVCNQTIIKSLDEHFHQLTWAAVTCTTAVRLARFVNRVDGDFSTQIFHKVAEKAMHYEVCWNLSSLRHYALTLTSALANEKWKLVSIVAKWGAKMQCFPFYEDTVYSACYCGFFSVSQSTYSNYINCWCSAWRGTKLGYIINNHNGVLTHTVRWMVG